VELNNELGERERERDLILIQFYIERAGCVMQMEQFHR
jgi:hypothetical protein